MNNLQDWHDFSVGWCNIRTLDDYLYGDGVAAESVACRAVYKLQMQHVSLLPFWTGWLVGCQKPRFFVMAVAVAATKLLVTQFVPCYAFCYALCWPFNYIISIFININWIGRVDRFQRKEKVDKQLIYLLWTAGVYVSGFLSCLLYLNKWTA